MDALSKILDDLHLHGAEYVYVSGCHDWHLYLDTQGEVIFHIVLWGQCWIELHDHAAQALHGGDIVVLPTGKTHRLYAKTANAPLSAPYNLYPEFYGHRHDTLSIGGTGRAHSLLLSIRCFLDVEMAKPLLGALPPLMTIGNAIDGGAPPWLQIGLQFLALEAERSRPGRDTLINRLVGMLLIECVRDYIEQLPNHAQNWLTALRDPQLSAALSAIHAHPEKNWSVTELAALAYMSRSAFAERFSRIMGQAPLSYLAAHRLRLAASYLRANMLSIARIAEKVGYASETAFSQAFKRMYGLSPSQYRRQHLATP